MVEAEASAEEAEAAEASATEAEEETEVASVEEIEAALVAEELQEEEVPHEAEVVPEEVLVLEPRSSFNLTSDSKAFLSYVERTTLSLPRILTQESPSITKNV